MDPQGPFCSSEINIRLFSVWDCSLQRNAVTFAVVNSKGYHINAYVLKAELFRYPVNHNLSMKQHNRFLAIVTQSNNKIGNLKNEI